MGEQLQRLFFFFLTHFTFNLHLSCKILTFETLTQANDLIFIFYFTAIFGHLQSLVEEVEMRHLTDWLFHGCHPQQSS